MTCLRPPQKGVIGGFVTNSGLTQLTIQPPQKFTASGKAPHWYLHKSWTTLRLGSLLRLDPELLPITEQMDAPVQIVAQHYPSGQHIQHLGVGMALIVLRTKLKDGVYLTIVIADLYVVTYNCNLGMLAGPPSEEEA